MTQETSSAIAILRRAMSIEQEGGAFYLKAAKETLDKKGQEMFAVLARDERSHLSLLKGQYDALKQNKNWVAAPGLQAVSIDLTKPLFPRGIRALKKAVAIKSSDWDALVFGLDIEIKSYDLYRKSAMQVTDAAATQIFKFLTEQEMGHFNMLMMRYESLFGPQSWYD